MTALPMSRAAAHLLRALLARAAQERDRFLLTSIRSTDWQSLTFSGERHVLTLRVIPPDAASIAHRFVAGIEDHEFMIPGETVADITATAGASADSGDSVELRVEALTIRE